MHFTANGTELDYTFIDFCDWAVSNRRNETILQMLMEYLVSRSLSCVNMANRAVRGSCAEYLSMNNGKKLSIRTGFYVKSLYPEHPDWIGFDIEHIEPDVFIFCVNRSMQIYSMPTNLDVWDFYVLPGVALVQYSKAHIVTLPAIQLMRPIKCCFNGIVQAVSSV